MASAKEIETYLRCSGRCGCAAKNAVLGACQTNDLVVLAEYHYEPELKARFLANLIGLAESRQKPRFHVSEHFDADPATRAAIRKYISSSQGDRRQLPSYLQPYHPLLEAARTFPGRAFAVLAANALSDRKKIFDDGIEKYRKERDRTIFEAFSESVQQHNAAFPGQRIAPGTSSGIFLLGAAHGAREDDRKAPGSTTTQLLAGAGYSVHVVRTTVRSTRRESIEVETATGGGDTIDLVPLLDRVAGGSAFYVPITAASPFAKLRPKGKGRPTLDRLYHAFLHLPN